MISLSEATFELYRIRMEQAAALRNQSTFLEQLAAATATESTLRANPTAPLSAYLEADRAVAVATLQRNEGEARLDGLYKQERVALQQWIAAVAGAP